MSDYEEDDEDLEEIELNGCGVCKDCHYRDGALFMQDLVLEAIEQAEGQWRQYNGAKRIADILRKRVISFATERGKLTALDEDRPEAEDTCGVLRRQGGQGHGAP